jgi:hypothetical protein
MPSNPKVSAMNVAIYRAVFGPYDAPLEDKGHRDGFDRFLYSDLDQNGFTNYEKIKLPPPSNPALKNRELKLLVPTELHKYDVVVYIDANIQICRNIIPLIRLFSESNADIGFFQHPYSNSLEREIETVVSSGKSDRKKIELEQQSFGTIVPRLPLTDNSILFRRNFPNIKAFSENWYFSVANFSGRDQLSSPYLRTKHGVNEHVFNWSPREPSNKYFVVYPHAPKAHQSKKEKLLASALRAKKRFESYIKSSV